MIHQYKLNGFNIVLDVNSGSVHCVDDVAYDIISLFCEKDLTGGKAPGRKVDPYDGKTPGGNADSYDGKAPSGNADSCGGKTLSNREDSFAESERVSAREDIVSEISRKYPGLEREEIHEVIRDVEELEADGKLFSGDIYEPRAQDLKNRHTEVKALCLHVAHTCNLNCGYCFAAQGNFTGKSGLMSFETGKRALDFLIENSGDRVNLEVDFFGGEPLMNWSVVKDLVRYARYVEKERGKNFRFTLTTNGVGIDDEVIRFANEEMHNVVLSLDGRKETHDRFRKYPDGRGSYEDIVPKFRELVRARNGVGYYIRGTFTHANTDFCKDVLHMAGLGFDQLSMEPVVCDRDDPSALTEDDLPMILEQYEILAKEMIKRKKEGRPITFYHYMIDLEAGPCIYKRISGCGSGTEYFAVTPWGELFPCHRFVGEGDFSMGNIWDGITREDIKNDFKMCNVYSREECRNCWARLYCSGGCAANAFYAADSILGVYEYGCKLFKKRIECAIMMKVAEAFDD